jgi:hypothetical protein
MARTTKPLGFKGITRLGESSYATIWFVASALILVGLGVIVVLLRLHRLSELPPGLFFDEGAHGMDALEVLKGQHSVFFPENQGREGLIVYAVALLIPILDRTILAIRLPTALASAGAVFAVFWLGQILFGQDEESGQRTRWRALFIATVAAGLLAVSIGQTIIGRIAYRANFMPLLLALSVALLWSGWVQRSRWRLVLAGITTGLLPYTYIPARFVPFLLLFFAASLLIWRLPNTAQSVRSRLPEIVTYLGVSALVAAPILVHFALYPEHFSSRSSSLWVFDPALNHGDPLGTFLRNMWDHLAVFGFRGDPNWRHNFDYWPMLNPVEAVFFWFGVGIAVWHWRRPAYRLPILWLAVLILPAVLALDTPPNTLRMIGMVPAIYLLIGVGLWETSLLLRGRLFTQMKIVPSITATLLAGGLILGQGILTYQAYFHSWATDTDVYQTYHAEWTHLVRAVNGHAPDSGIVYLIPIGNQFQEETFREYNFEFLYQGTVPVHLFHAATPGLVQGIESALAAAAPVSTAKVVDWTNGVHWSGDATGRFSYILGKYGRHVSSEINSNYTIHNFTDLKLDHPWSLFEYLDPLTVVYDGGITLQGIAVGRHGGQQLSAGQIIDLDQDRFLWLALQWQASRTPDADFWISLRLHNAVGDPVYQRDTAIWNFDHAPTARWQPGEESENLVHLILPSDLPVGEYELRLIVYNAETLHPTVQVDLWAPEVTLARVRLGEIE